MKNPHITVQRQQQQQPPAASSQQPQQQPSDPESCIGDLASKDVRHLRALARDTFQQAKTKGNVVATLSASLGDGSHTEECASLRREMSRERMKQILVQADAEGMLEVAMAKVCRAKETRGSSVRNPLHASRTAEELRLGARQAFMQAAMTGTLTQ